MRCPTQDCPGAYEPREVVHTMRRGGQIIVIDHVPAEVCTICGDVLFAPDTVRRLETLRATSAPPPAPSRYTSSPMPVPPREAEGPSLEPHRQAMPASEAACERAWAVIGRYHGGATDVAENHDAYLDEAYGAWPSVRCLPEQPDGTE